MNQSLRSRLFVRMLAVVGLLVALVFVGTRWVTETNLQKAQDQALNAVAQVIADSVILESGRPAFELPYAAFEVLAYQAEEALIYQVSNTQGRILAGKQDLPLLTQGGQTRQYLGVPVRFFKMTKALNNQAAVSVVLGQTQGQLKAQVNSVAARTALFCALAFLMIGAWVYWALSEALKPLAGIRRELASKNDDDFSPVSTRVPKEIETLVTELNRVMHNHEGLLEQSRRFIAEATHQLRTPIAALSARADLLAREAPAALAEEASDLAIQARETSRLTHQLLTRAAISYRQSQGQRVPTDPVQLAEQTLRRFEFIAEQRDIGLVLDGKAHFKHRLDPISVREALACLLENALHVAPVLSDIVLGISDTQDTLTFTIRDQGPGWRENSVPGLGSKIADQVARAHAGKLTVAALPEGGTQCTLLLSV